MASDCLIGIDIGTSVVKAILIDSAGRRLAGFTQPVPISRPLPGCAEQDPADWMTGLVGALTEFTSRHDLSRLGAIGISSQANTHVFVDSGGNALVPAITWQDTRCAPDAAELAGQIGAAQSAAWLGRPVPIDASHALSR